MTEQVSAFQTGSLTFEIRGPIGNPSEFVQTTLSKVEKIIVTEATASLVEGHYQFGGGDLLVSFAVSIEQPSAELTTLELRFKGNDPEWRTDMIRDKISEALAVTSAASSQSAAPPQKPKPLKAATQNKARTDGHRMAPQASAVSSSDYKTTSGLGSLFAVIGWLGVVFSLIGGLGATQTIGLAGIAAGFIAALFCLMIVAAGQLLRAQVEVANNSRLILQHLDALNSARD